MASDVGIRDGIPVGLLGGTAEQAIGEPADDLMGRERVRALGVIGGVGQEEAQTVVDLLEADPRCAWTAASSSALILLGSSFRGRGPAGR